MDYNKINEILNTYNTSPSLKRALNYSTAEMQRTERFNDYQADRKNDAYNSVMDRIQGIEKMANEVTFNRPGVLENIQEVYKEERDKLSKTIIEKYGGDITKFYYGGGQAELDMFERNLFGGEEMQNLLRSKPEVEKYLDAVTGKKGNKSVFHSTQKRYLQFQSGLAPTFNFGETMIPYKDVPSSYIEKAPQGMRLIDVYLGFGDNENIAKYNYYNEKGLSPDTEVGYETIAQYAGGYLGGYEGPQSLITSNDPKLSKTLFESITALGNNSNLNQISKRDGNVKMQVERLTELAGLNLNEQVSEGPIGGYKAFKGDETKMVEIFVDPLFDSKDFVSDALINEDGDISIDHNTGEWFGGNGEKLNSSETLPTLQQNGVFLGFKTLDGTNRLLFRDELESHEGKVKPVMMLNLKNDGYFGDDYYYKELRFDSARRSKKLNELFKIEEDELVQQMNYDYNSKPSEEKIKVSFADINMNSSSNRFYEYAQYNDSILENKLPALGLENPTLKTKSTLLASKLLFGIDEMEDFLQQLHVSENPDLNDGLITNDPQLFLHNLKLIVNKRGASEEEANNLINTIAELSKKINNAVINKHQR